MQLDRNNDQAGENSTLRRFHFRSMRDDLGVAHARARPRATGVLHRSVESGHSGSETGFMG
ncbi:hypothetical protein H7F50_12575 [Novosphingobium flavum]|uniref:Uncharacterized protein n=1 Tax=Novosphingobium aerophilum TaxID=2839843 RepID=A0A7X1F9A1_9SPHN|nr:hypothetical protein [Novosphingobium aerophilum]MBC2652539.1 hypothetical protein [Novosphingobium aerophilum]MBC2662589.1 hypothetical protein [Novosphingobium aerophilum]